jgi:serine/threonine-protein kinase HipA
VALDVYRNQSLVGRLDIEAGEPFYGFSYASEYLESPSALPLSLSLPLQAARFTGLEALPYFEGLLPEGDYRDAIAKRLGIPYTSSVRLLAALGRDCAGDVSVVDADEHAAATASRYAPLQGGLQGIAESPYTVIAKLLDETRLSLAGGQEKAALLHIDTQALEEGWYIPLQGSPSTHIIKPGPMEARYPHLALNEFLCLRAAASCGIPVVDLDIRFAGSPLLVVRRYDRLVGVAGVDGIPKVTRLHQEDCCQAAGVPSDSKYEGDGGPGFGQVRELLARHGLQPATDIASLAKLALFNYLIGNCDAHAKNISLLQHAGGAVTLAPAYDLISTTIYDGTYGMRLSRSLGMAIGAHANIDKVDASDFGQLAAVLSIRASQLAAYAEEAHASLEPALLAAAAEAELLGFDAAGEMAGRIIADSQPRATMLLR